MPFQRFSESLNYSERTSKSQINGLLPICSTDPPFLLPPPKYSRLPNPVKDNIHETALAIISASRLNLRMDYLTICDC
jgi:hypothetical protein